MFCVGAVHLVTSTILPSSSGAILSLCFRLPSDPKHLTVAEPQSDVALKVSKCLEWSWPNGPCCVVCVVVCPLGPCSTVLPPSADCLSWRIYLALNSLSSDIMTLSTRPAESLLRGRWKCLRAFHFRAKHDCLHTLWQTSWQQKKKNLSVIVSFSVRVIASLNHSPA